MAIESTAENGLEVKGGFLSYDVDSPEATVVSANFTALTAPVLQTILVDTPGVIITLPEISTMDFLYCHITIMAIEDVAFGIDIDAGDSIGLFNAVTNEAVQNISAKKGDFIRLSRQNSTALWTVFEISGTFEVV